MYDHHATVWPLTVLGCVALIGAVITAGITSAIPHDLIGIGIGVVGYLMGLRIGQLREQVHTLNGKNGNGGKPPEPKNSGG